MLLFIGMMLVFFLARIQISAIVFRLSLQMAFPTNYRRVAMWALFMAKWSGQQELLRKGLLDLEEFQPRLGLIEVMELAICKLEDLMRILICMMGRLVIMMV